MAILARRIAGNLLVIAAAVFLTVVRLLIPTVGHSWTMVFITGAHIFVGVMLTLLWQKQGKWPLGWICLGVPTAVEAAMFFAANG